MRALAGNFYGLPPEALEAFGQVAEAVINALLVKSRQLRALLDNQTERSFRRTRLFRHDDGGPGGSWPPEDTMERIKERGFVLRDDQHGESWFRWWTNRYGQERFQCFVLGKRVDRGIRGMSIRELIELSGTSTDGMPIYIDVTRRPDEEWGSIGWGYVYDPRHPLFLWMDNILNEAQETDSAAAD